MGAGRYKKGESGNPNGRPKGVPNKQTQDIRAAYQKLTENNLENMTVWLQQIAADDPARAMDMMLKLSEFIIPKLARQELVGNDGEDLFANIKFQFGPDINDKQDRVQE